PVSHVANDLKHSRAVVMSVVRAVHSVSFIRLCHRFVHTPTLISHEPILKLLQRSAGEDSALGNLQNWFLLAGRRATTLSVEQACAHGKFARSRVETVWV